MPIIEPPYHEELPPEALELVNFLITISGMYRIERNKFLASNWDLTVRRSYWNHKIGGFSWDNGQNLLQIRLDKDEWRNHSSNIIALADVFEKGNPHHWKVKIYV